jgi:tRNA (guanosine-2'-O-)-methyltransferase
MTDTEDAADNILEQFILPQRLKRLEDVLVQRSKTLTIVLDRVQNYHNISAVVRSADAFGVAEIHLIGDVFEYSRKITLGTERWVSLVRHASAEEALPVLKNMGYSLVVLQPENHNASKNLPPSMAVTDLPFEKPLALIFGNEKDGISRIFAEAADVHAYIPMKGFVESLNISVACAICLFCSTIAPTQAIKRTQSLSSDDQQELRSQWLRKGVRRSDVILREVVLRKDWPAKDDE